MNLQYKIDDFKNAIEAQKESIVTELEKALSMPFMVRKKLPLDNDEWIAFVRFVFRVSDLLERMKITFLFVTEAREPIKKVSDHFQRLYGTIVSKFFENLTIDLLLPIISDFESASGAYLCDVCPEIDFWTGQIIKQEVAKLNF